MRRKSDHIIDPIIRQLGYPGKDDVYLNLEEKLEYPYIHIGRRSKRDQPLGFPDFRAGLKGARGSFIVEAKSGNSPITSKEVEQAHSYAAHAQVGANYFVLCNGIDISVYETLSGPKSFPIVNLQISEINQKFFELENILSPESLAKNCQVAYDRHLKIAEGLGSSVSIRSGHYLMSSYEYHILVDEQDCTEFFQRSFPQLSEMDKQLELMKTAFELRVSGGFAERGEDGRIVAHAEFTGATTHNHQAMAIMGITEATFATSDKFISMESSNPTIFESSKDFSVPRGTLLPLFFGGSFSTEADVEGSMFIKAAMFYRDGKMLGQYISISEQKSVSLEGQDLALSMKIVGTFELNLLVS